MSHEMKAFELFINAFIIHTLDADISEYFLYLFIGWYILKQLMNLYEIYRIYT